MVLFDKKRRDIEKLCGKSGRALYCVELQEINRPLVHGLWPNEISFLGKTLSYLGVPLQPSSGLRWTDPPHSWEALLDTLKAISKLLPAQLVSTHLQLFLSFQGLFTEYNTELAFSQRPPKVMLMKDYPKNTKCICFSKCWHFIFLKQGGPSCRISSIYHGNLRLV